MPQDLSATLDLAAYAALTNQIAAALNVSAASLVGKQFYQNGSTGQVSLLTPAGYVVVLNNQKKPVGQVVLTTAQLGALALAHAQNTDIELAVGTGDQVTAHEVRQFLDGQYGTSGAAIAAETARAEAAETANLAAAKTYTDTSVATEAAARTSADTTNLNAAKTYADTGVAAEAATRGTADSSLQSQITAEVSRATGAEAAAVTTAVTQATAQAKSYTDGSIATEATARTGGDAATLAAAKTYSDGNLATETAARSAGDATTLSSARTYTDGSVATEAAARSSGDTAAVASAKSYTDGAIATEAAARLSGDASTLSSAHGYTDSSVGAEAAARSSGDNYLQAEIADEITDRQNGDVATLASAKSYTDAETTNREAAVSAAIETAAAYTDQATAAKAFTIAQVTAEAQTRATADSQLQSSITAEATARAQADSAEVTARIAGDSNTLALAKAYTDEVTGGGDVGASFLHKDANLSDLSDAAAARANLGLGSAATQSSSAFDPAGAATAATAAAQATSLQKTSNLNDLASVPAARSALGLGSAALMNTTAFDGAGAAAAAQAASDPLGSAAAVSTSLASSAGAACVGTAQGSTVQAQLDALRNSTPMWASASGTGNAIVLTTVPATTAYINGMRIGFKAPGTNAAGAVTINAGAGAVPAVDYAGVAVAQGDIQLGDDYEVVYDSTANAFRVVSAAILSGPDGASRVGTAGASNVQADLSARPTSAALAANGGAAAIGTSTGLSVEARLNALAGAGISFTPTAVKSGSYNASAGDFIPFDLTSTNGAINLPAAPADKTVIAAKIVKLSGTNTLTLNCGGADVFNVAGGSTNATLSLLMQGIILQYSASAAIWYVLSDDLPLGRLDARYAPATSGTSLLKGNGTGGFSSAAAGTDYPGLASANSYTQAQTSTPVVGTINGAVSINLGNLSLSTGVTWSTSPLPATANNLDLTPTGNVTSLTLTNGTDGTFYDIALVGASTYTWPPSISGANFGTAGMGTITATAGSVSLLSGRWRTASSFLRAVLSPG